MTNQLAPFLSQINETLTERIYGHISGHGSSTGIRLLLIVGLVIFAHVTVKFIRRNSEWFVVQRNTNHKKYPRFFKAEQSKFVTVFRLAVSAIIFVIYFVALGLILQEAGVNLTAYLASAGIIGLAISFGSQGLVQDIVSGLTLIFCDAMDVGDLVEIASLNTIVIGRVEKIGLRFTTLVNFLHQKVLIPNRNIGTVSRFPPGGVDAYVNVQIPTGADTRQIVQIVGNEAKGMWEQFGAIILSEPMIGKVEPARGGTWSFFRVHFKILPGQGALIETTFRQRLISALKSFDSNYSAWQIPVTYRAVTFEEKIMPPLVSSKHGQPFEHLKGIDTPAPPRRVGEPDGVLVAASHPIIAASLPSQKSEN